MSDKHVCRAKMNCDEVSKVKHWNPKGPGQRFLYKAKFSVVYGGDEENDKYFEATPSGSLELGTFKEDFFVPGQSYYIDFTEAPELEG